MLLHCIQEVQYLEHLSCFSVYIPKNIQALKDSSQYVSLQHTIATCNNIMAVESMRFSFQCEEQRLML